MEVKINRLASSQVELEIELPSKEFDKFIEKATLNLGRDLEVEGFRKGKAPKQVIEEKVGKNRILAEAAELAVKENYRKAVLENKIEAVSPPRVEILKLAQGNPLLFRAKFSVLPEVNLPDYKKICSGIKRNKVLIEEKEIEGALKWLQKSRAKLSLKNQPVQKGDFIEIGYGSPQLGKQTKDAFILGEGHFLPGFEEKLIGLEVNQEKEVSVEVPKNHFLKNLAGKKVDLKVKVISVQKVKLPEITDDFAKSLGEFKDLVSLKTNIKQGLTSEKEQAEIQRIRAEILEKISQRTKCQVPENLVQNEQQRLLENLKRDVSQRLKVSFEEYLKKIKKTEKEILDSFSDQAQKRIKEFLVLKEIGKRERIEVSEEEIKEEMDKILKHYATAHQTEEKLDPEKLKEYTKEAKRTEKIFKLLESLTI